MRVRPRTLGLGLGLGLGLRWGPAELNRLHCIAPHHPVGAPLFLFKFVI